MAAIRPESKVRARALQLLYAWEVRGCPPLEEVAQMVGDDRSQPAFADAARVAAEVVGSHADLDREIEEVIEGWTYTRVGVIERNILRLALHELMSASTPPKVVLNEAVRLAQWFAGAKAPAFVNGVLDALARRHQSL